MAHTAYLPIIADRYGAVVRHIYIVGLDLTGIDMRAQVRLYGDVPGAPLIDLRTVTNGNAQGLRLVEVTTEAGLPTSHVELVINESTMEGLPFAGEIGDVTTLAWDWQVTIAGRKRRLAKGEFQITGDGVTGAEVAPTNRIQPYGLSQRPLADVWSSARMTFGEEQVTVQIDGADLVAPLAKKATDAAEQAERSRTAADLASATALAASRYFATKAAGEAASAAGQLFSTNDGSGSLIYYQRTASGSTEVGRAATPAALAAGSGSGMIGFLLGKIGAVVRSVQARLSDWTTLKDFGATGDRAQDATDAFSKWLDAGIADGGTLYAPPGVYRITVAQSKKLAARGFSAAGRQITIQGAGRANTFFLYEGAAEQPMLTLTGNPGSFDLFRVSGVSFIRPDAGPSGMPSREGVGLRLVTMNMVELNSILTFRNGLGIHLVGCLNVFINGYYSCYERNGLFAERGVATDPKHPVNPNANQISMRDFNFVQTADTALHIKDGTGLTLSVGGFESIGRERQAASVQGTPKGLYLEDCGLDGAHVLSGCSGIYVEANLGLDVLIKQRAVNANYDFRGWNFNRAGGPADRTVNAIRFDASTLPAGACQVTINVDGVHFNKYGAGYQPSATTPAIEFRLGGGTGQRFDGLTFSDANTSYPDPIERPSYLDDQGNTITMAPVSRPVQVSVAGRILPTGAGAASIDRQRGLKGFTFVGPGVYDLDPILGTNDLVLTPVSNTPGVVAFTYADGGKQRIDCRRMADGAQVDAVVTFNGVYG